MKDTFNSHPIYSMDTQLSPNDEKEFVYNKLRSIVYPNLLRNCTSMYKNGLLKLDPFSVNFETHRLSIPHWTLVPVWGKIDDDSFFYMLSRLQFPVNQQLRHKDNLSYVYLRDTWHDTIGHLPFLYDKDYTDMMVLFGLAYTLYKSDSPDYFTQQTETNKIKRTIARLYWSIVEFGMMEEDGEIKPLGAGIMSSNDELLYAINKRNKTQKEFNMTEISEWNYDPFGKQDRHYIVPNIPFVINHLKNLLKS